MVNSGVTFARITQFVIVLKHLINWCSVLCRSCHCSQAEVYFNFTDSSQHACTGFLKLSIVAVTLEMSARITKPTFAAKTYADSSQGTIVGLW